MHVPPTVEVKWHLLFLRLRQRRPEICFESATAAVGGLLVVAVVGGPRGPTRRGRGTVVVVRVHCFYVYHVIMRRSLCLCVDSGTSLIQRSPKILSLQVTGLRPQVPSMPCLAVVGSLRTLQIRMQVHSKTLPRKAGNAI